MHHFCIRQGFILPPVLFAPQFFHKYNRFSSNFVAAYSLVGYLAKQMNHILLVQYTNPMIIANYCLIASSLSYSLPSWSEIFSAEEL